MSPVSITIVSAARQLFDQAIGLRRRALVGRLAGGAEQLAGELERRGRLQVTLGELER